MDEEDALDGGVRERGREAGGGIDGVHGRMVECGMRDVAG